MSSLIANVVTFDTPGPPGPPGPLPQTTLTASFTQPIGTGAVTVAVESTAPFPALSYVFHPVGGYYQVAAVIDATDLSLVNLGLAGNASQLSTVPIGNLYATGAPGGGPGAVLGSAQVGPNSGIVENAQDWVNVPAGTTLIVYTLPPPAIVFKEVVSFSAYVQVTNALGGSIGRISRMIEVVNNSGTIMTPNGGTTDTNITPDPSNAMASALAGTSAAIVIAGSTLAVQVTAPSGTSIWAKVTGSVDRGKLPGTGPVPTVTSSTVTSGPGAGGTAGVLTGTGFTFATTVTLDGIVASFTIVNDTTINFTSGAFFGIPATGDIVVSNLNGPGSLPGGWTYSTTGATPLTLFAATLKGWWRGDSLVQSGGLVTAWNDLSGNGQNATAVGSPTYNAASAHVTPPGPSATCNGTTQYFDIASFIQAASGHPNVFFFMVGRVLGAGGSMMYFNVAGYTGLGLSAGAPKIFATNGASTWGSSVQNLTKAMACYFDGTAAGSNFSFVDVSNGSEVTSTAANSVNTNPSGELRLGNDTGFLGFANVEFFEAGMVAAPTGGPSGAQLSVLQAYFVGRYGSV